MNTEEFIQKARQIHGNKYDYSKVNYVDRNKTKVEIICPKHGAFWQLPGNHLAGKCCLKCSGKYKPSKEEFIQKANNIHNFIYDYSKINYINAKTKIEIICPKHGSFLQTPYCHTVRKQGCPVCGKEKEIKYNTINDCVDDFKKIHGNKYDYSKTQLTRVGKRILLNIVCPKHGEFVQRLDQHLVGKGCPKCSESKGENYIRTILEEKNIYFETEKTFNGLNGYNNGLLRFDFWLPDYSAVIEYNGKQHYIVEEYFGGEEELKKRIYNDKQKAEWCIKNNIDLFIIDKCPHGSFCNKDRLLIRETIEKILDKKIKKR